MEDPTKKEGEKKSPLKAFLEEKIVMQGVGIEEKVDKVTLSIGDLPEGNHTIIRLKNDKELEKLLNLLDKRKLDVEGGTIKGNLSVISIEELTVK